MSALTAWSREWPHGDAVTIVDLHEDVPGWPAVTVTVRNGHDGNEAAVAVDRHEWLAGVMQASGITRDQIHATLTASLAAGADLDALTDAIAALLALGPEQP